MRYPDSSSKAPSQNELRLETVTTCVGFDDLLDATLTANHPHVDTAIVVTSHKDKRTQGVAFKHGAICVQTDLFSKNGRIFNKGAAINAGFLRFQYNGWRLHLDADIALPDNFRRLLFNHTHLDTDCLYGADRLNIYGKAGISAVQAERQHHHTSLLSAPGTLEMGSRYIHPLHGYLPIGYFQLWHASCQHDYPYSLGTAGHDDTGFAMQWPESQRRLLPGALVYHILTDHEAVHGENWEGKRRQPRLS
jgi:hypothetical protein